MINQKLIEEVNKIKARHQEALSDGFYHNARQYADRVYGMARMSFLAERDFEEYEFLSHEWAQMLEANRVSYEVVA